MHSRVLILFALGSLLTACAFGPQATPVPAAAPTAASTIAPTAVAQAKPDVLVVAHRGGAALAPENTMAAFENALTIGVDQVECDVHLSKDGELVVMHDPDVSRTTNGVGQIRERATPVTRASRKRS